MDLVVGKYTNFFRTSLWSLLLFSLAEIVHPVLITNAAMIPVLLNSLSKERYTPRVSSTFMKEYDYIVVGAGSAGSVVASRLSEEPCVNVLLLEAGGHPPLLSEVPSLALLMWFTNVDWQMRTVPLKHTGRGLINGQMPLPRGKMLGGSSSINNLMYVRGNRNNYDLWAAQGAKGWSYKEVFPYFLKLEDNRTPQFLANGYHNISGPVSAEQPRYTPLVKQNLYEAITSLGYQFVDSNAERQTGFYDLEGHLRNGQRCSSAKGYLVPAENRKNLDIIINAMVKKVLIHKRRAVGVEFDLGGRTFQVRAKREVIVSAGSFKTPQLLMLSGIGPREELKKFNIPVLANLPVGRNLHDHAGTLMIYRLRRPVKSLIERFLNPKTIIQYVKNRSGPLSSVTFLIYLAWFKGNSTSSPIDYPNYQLYFGELVSTLIGYKWYGLRPEVYAALYGPYDFKPLLLCLVQQTQPRSRGTVTLNSTSIYDMPLIDPNYLADERDIDDMVQGMKTCDRISLSGPMRKVGSEPLATLIPGCESFANDVDQYYRCQLRTILISAHHNVGTAKMGDPRDPTTVVDPELRVKRIKGLRVVDASVMPTITSGNTNIPTTMIAEKASDMIRRTIRCHANKEEDWTTDHKDFPEEQNEEKKQSLFDSSLDILISPKNISLGSPFKKQRKQFSKHFHENRKKFFNLKGKKCFRGNCEKSLWTEFDENMLEDPGVDARTSDDTTDPE